MNEEFIRGRRLTDIESLNLIRGRDLSSDELSKMESAIPPKMQVDGFEFKNGEYIIPYVDVNDMEALQDKINQVWEQYILTGEEIKRIIIKEQ